MAGIRLKNFQEGGVIARNYMHGADLWLPPCDPEFICLFQGIQSADADADFTLNPAFVSHGLCLPWPQQLHVVLQNNRTSNTGAPGVLQANPNIAGSRWFDVRVTGKLNGKARSEVLRVDVNTILLPSGSQLAHLKTVQTYDEITSVRHEAKVGSWGSAQELFVGVGTGVGLFGEAALQRQSVYAPLKPTNVNKLRNLWFPDTGESALQGSGTSAYAYGSNGELDVPTRSRTYGRSLGALVVTSSTSARLVTLVAHGLKNGDAVRVRHLDNGLPGGLALNTTYYVRVLSVDTFMLTATPTPVNFTTQATGETLTATAHGLANATPVLIQQALVGGVLTTIPAPLAANTVYFVVNTAANTIQLESTVGGGAINITGTDTTVGVIACATLATGGNFATGETIEVLRPRATWERARLVYTDGENVEKTA